MKKPKICLVKNLSGNVKLESQDHKSTAASRWVTAWPRETRLISSPQISQQFQIIFHRQNFIFKNIVTEFWFQRKSFPSTIWFPPPLHALGVKMYKLSFGWFPLLCWFGEKVCGNFQAGVLDWQKCTGT